MRSRQQLEIIARSILIDVIPVPAEIAVNKMVDFLTAFEKTIQYEVENKPPVSETPKLTECCTTTFCPRHQGIVDDMMSRLP